MNLKDVRIFDYVEDAEGKKKPVLNKKETTIAQQKQDLIKAEFDNWIWKNPDRRERLTKLYNERFNSVRPREYDGSHITFSGMNPEIVLRKHQEDAVARVMYGGNTLLGHVVGAGKTWTMVAAAMEMKRLGLCNKSLFVVPNHLTEQWASEFLQLYPAANILVATKKDFETKNRKKFCGRIATGDYDAVIIGHSQFEKIPMSIERQKTVLERQKTEIMHGIIELKAEKGERFTIKQLEKSKKAIEARLEKLNDQSRKDDVVTFEELGGGSYSSTTVKVTDKDGKTVSVTKSTTTTKATLTLPTGKNLLEDDNYYTITVTSGSKAKADYTVVLKDKKGNEVTGTTNADGIIVLPGKEHKSYIVGYDDGSFRPDNDMTRSEAAAIFARLISEEKGEAVSGKATFSDVNSKSWAYKYIGYLEKYDIIKGYSDGTFRPDAKVTRAEFVAMAVRYYALFNEVKKSDYTVNYTDLTKSYWAYSDIAYAKHIGWLNGYADGTFKGDNNITRAEVVTVTNHATNRTPDEDYINKNVSTLNKFTDLKNNSHWAYYDILEAANTHRGISNSDTEIWVK